MAFARGSGRRVAGVVAGLAIVLGCSTALGVVFVQRTLVDDTQYRHAFARANAYERVYTEVLADPVFAELNDDLIGRLTPSASNATQLRALSTSALRWTLPPSRLRAVTEEVLAQLLAYVRGESPRLDGAVSVADVLARVDDAAITEVRTLLADAVLTVATSLEEYELQIRRFVDELASGRVPDAMPVLGGTEFDPQRVLELVLAELGDDLDERTRERIVAATLSGNEREALIDAGAMLVAAHAAQVSEDLRAGTVGGGEIDVIASIADRAEVAPSEVVGRFNDARDVTRVLSARVGVFAAGAAVLGAVVLVVGLRRSPRRAAAVVGGCVALGGLGFALAGYLVARRIGAPLAAAAGTGVDGWSLPEPLRVLVGDVEGNLREEFRARAVTLAVALVVAGGVLVVGAAFLARPFVRRRELGVLAAGALVAGLVVSVVPVGSSEPEPDRTCNGAVELCDRRYDEVVYAATHNSMSSPDVVFVWPEHDHDLRAQLDNGVRALLIDTHYWTELASAAELTAAEPLLPEGVASRAFDSLVARRRARPGTYLCHAHCAMGEIPFVDALREVRSFLDDNPREVVTLIIQDAITRADTAAAFTKAGLDDYLHTHRPGSRWATLGSLIERDERLVVFSEKQGTPPGWYHPAFTYIQETPYLFRSPAELSCAPNRGDPRASLFLMNHWVQRVAPDRADAAVLNRRELIVARAEQCRRERGLLPNFIAVNFANIGDVTGAVAELNGLR